MTSNPTTVTIEIHIPTSELAPDFAGRINTFANDLEAAGVDDVTVTLIRDEDRH